ncbi:hypothetical protein [Paenimyroides aestuarii]|uniref:Uncharacterized protein n=1 Tax=Paenimyroides aestuarii TaxID=2968490 RepID=A0ABY5NRQ7_9FLAO|nr:hypothetical protein [Paenimyroides aestuarii]UUV21247.1 hypothetical protein NPX36_13105 [Paenimyroides aestuarii]
MENKHLGVSRQGGAGYPLYLLFRYAPQKDAASIPHANLRFSKIVLLLLALITFNACAQHTEKDNNSTMNSKKDQLILEVTLSPGAPESHSYAYAVYADGHISLPGNTYSSAAYQLSTEQLENLHRQLKSIPMETLAEQKNKEAGSPPVHDGQTKGLKVYRNNRFYQVSYQIGSETIPKEINDFHSYFLELMAQTEE